MFFFFALYFLTIRELIKSYINTKTQRIVVSTFCLKAQQNLIQKKQKIALLNICFLLL